MTQPWVVDPVDLSKKSEFAFYGLIRRKKYYSIVLRKIETNQDQKRPLDIELIFEHR